MKFRIARESEFENARGRQNPLRGTALEERAVQMPGVLSTWLIEIADLEELRILHHEIVQIESGHPDPPNLSVDFLPHYENTPPDCDGVLFICD